MTKFKSQCLYIIRIKYWNASGSGSPPSLIPAHWNIGILHSKQAKMRKDMQQSIYLRDLSAIFLKFLCAICMYASVDTEHFYHPSLAQCLLRKESKIWAFLAWRVSFREPQKQENKINYNAAIFGMKNKKRNIFYEKN